jgi:hypothetical protein
MKSVVGGLRCGTGALKMTWQGLADFFPEDEDAEGFLNTAQGNVKRVAFFGFAQDAFQADLVQVQFIQEGGLMGLVDLVGGGGQGPAQMLGVTGERGDGEPVLGGQGAQGLPGLQSAALACLTGFEFCKLQALDYQASHLSP